MSFKQIIRNAVKNWKDHGLFFGSLVIVIVAFYTLLSLESQDVMEFLKTMESHAVEKLMLMVPLVYFVSLFFVFFLVYFAYRYQLDTRQKEFGLYMMMGMKKSKLFTMLVIETLFNSLVSILIGLPLALLLTEAISLTTAKLVGLGIIGHRISISGIAVLYTAIGFLAVQMGAMMLLCLEYGKKEPMQLLKSDAPKKQEVISSKKGWSSFVLGCVCLAIAYLMGVLLLRGLSAKIAAVIFVLGGAGTFLLYRGMGRFLGHWLFKRSQGKSGLYVFTLRQIQENVLSQHKSLAVSSLLLLVSLSCMSFGIGVACRQGNSNVRSVDFSISGSMQEVEAFLEEEENMSVTEASYPMWVGNIDTDRHTFSWGLGDALMELPETSLRDNMVEYLEGPGEYPYAISLTSFNSLLESIGKEPIVLHENQAALYTSMIDTEGFTKLLEGALGRKAFVMIDDRRYELLPDIYDDNIVADKKITLYTAVIISDEDYQNFVSKGEEPFSYNLLLKKEVVEENGLMQALKSMGERLTKAGIEYESYLSGFGRNLFYAVAASFLTIYIGVLFLLISNTVIGIKFLMQQRANQDRYLTLQMLGASTGAMCASGKKQIRTFFVLVFGVASVSAVFAVWSMFASFMQMSQGAAKTRMILLSAIVFILFILVEIVYIIIVERISTREIRALQVTDRR